VRGVFFDGACNDAAEKLAYDAGVHTGDAINNANHDTGFHTGL
jgi:hypothetical protein